MTVLSCSSRAVRRQKGLLGSPPPRVLECAAWPGAGGDLESCSQGSQMAPETQGPSQTLYPEDARELLGAPHLQLSPAAHRHGCRAARITRVCLPPVSQLPLLTPSGGMLSPGRKLAAHAENSLTCGTGRATDERSAQPREAVSTQPGFVGSRRA